MKQILECEAVFDPLSPERRGKTGPGNGIGEGTSLSYKPQRKFFAERNNFMTAEDWAAAREAVAAREAKTGVAHGANLGGAVRFPDTEWFIEPRVLRQDARGLSREQKARSVSRKRIEDYHNRHVETMEGTSLDGTSFHAPYLRKQGYSAHNVPHQERGLKRSASAAPKLSIEERCQPPATGEKITSSSRATGDRAGAGKQATRDTGKVLKQASVLRGSTEQDLHVLAETSGLAELLGGDRFRTQYNRYHGAKSAGFWPGAKRNPGARGETFGVGSDYGLRRRYRARGTGEVCWKLEHVLTQTFKV